jgi:hypothetical protein
VHDAEAAQQHGPDAGMSETRSGGRAGVAVGLWSASLMLVTFGLLAFAGYAASASSEDGPGATPLLMAGLLALCATTMALLSAVATARLIGDAGGRWWLRIAAVAAALVSPALLFPLAAYAGNPGEPVPTRCVTLALFVVCVVALFALNRIAIRSRRRAP